MLAKNRSFRACWLVLASKLVVMGCASTSRVDRQVATPNGKALTADDSSTSSSPAAHQESAKLPAEARTQAQVVMGQGCPKLAKATALPELVQVFPDWRSTALELYSITQLGTAEGKMPEVVAKSVSTEKLAKDALCQIAAGPQEEIEQALAHSQTCQADVPGEIKLYPPGERLSQRWSFDVLSNGSVLVTKWLNEPFYGSTGVNVTVRNEVVFVSQFDGYYECPLDAERGCWPNESGDMACNLRSDVLCKSKGIEGWWGFFRIVTGEMFQTRRVKTPEAFLVEERKDGHHDVSCLPGTSEVDQN